MLALLKRIPDWFWISLLGALAVTALVVWHGRVADKATTEAYQSGWDSRDNQFNTALLKAKADAQVWRERYEKAASDLTQQKREAHDQEIAATRARADDLILRGPGAAAHSCAGQGNRARPAASAGGSVEAPAAPAPALPSVPSDERLAVVPWNELVRRSASADEALAEAKTWRSWYLANVEELRKARLEIPEPALGGK